MRHTLRGDWLAAAAAAVAAPALIAFNLSPSGTFLNQVAAMVGAVVDRFAISPAAGRRALANDPILRRYEALPLRLSQFARPA